MSSNLGMATGELQSMGVQGGGESLWKEALKRLLKDRLAVLGGIIIVALIFIAFFARFLSPFDPSEQFKNGTTINGTPLPIGSYGKEAQIQLKPAPVERRLPTDIYFVSEGSASYEFKFQDAFVVPAGASQVSFPIKPNAAEMNNAPEGTALVAELPEGSAPLKFDISSMTLKNKEHFVLGTDSLGRDVLSRLIYGTRVSLLVGVVAIVLSVVIGSVLGLLSGYFGGWIDSVIMRFTDIMMAFPDLLLIMAIVAVVNPSDIALLKLLGEWGFPPEVLFICIAISVVSWTQYARLVRSQVLSVREMEYIEASKSLGAKDVSIMFGHVLPNVIAPVIVVATMGIAGAIMTEAALSFLGFGVKVPTASWGSMINEGLGYFREIPMIPLVPGLAIAITVFAFNLFGDGVRDALDPRLK